MADRHSPMRRHGASAGAASGLAVQMAMAMTLAVTLTLTLAWPLPCSAADAPAVAANPVLEARMMALAAELRCLVCQNQSLADSHAGLAEDLRQQIREMLAKGQSERQVLDYMADRYGDFVLYRPPLKAATALLWGAPVLLMAGAVGGLFIVLRRRQRLGAEAFDPDTPDEEPPR